MSNERTHVVGVLAVIFHEGRILLLKRRTPPTQWAPPGGRLRADEDPLAGLNREIAEECSARVDILGPFATWQGTHDRANTLGIIYVGYAANGQVALSDEHSAAHWFTHREIERMHCANPADLFGPPSLYRLAQRVALILREPT